MSAPATPRPQWWRHWVVLATAAYLAIRAVTTVLLALASHRQEYYAPWTSRDPGFWDVMVLWDGTWYRHIAEWGYPTVPPVGPDGHLLQNEWGFYPAFPYLARFVMWLTGAGFPVVGSMLSLVCGLGAAVLMVALFRRRMSTAASLAAMAVWASYAASPALQIAYSDALAMLLLVGWFLLVDDEHWFRAGLLLIPMGLTRPLAAPLLAVLGLLLLGRLLGRRDRPLERTEVMRGFGGLLVGSLGVIAWPLIAWAVTGSRTTYTDTMAAWRPGQGLDLFGGWGVFTEWAMAPTGWPLWLAPYLLTGFAVAYAASMAGPWAARVAPSARLWVLAYGLYVAAVGTPFTSIFRHALPLFPIAVVLLGVGWRDRPARTWPLRLVVLLIIGFLLQAAWIWKLLIFHPPTDYAP